MKIAQAIGIIFISSVLTAGHVAGQDRIDRKLAKSIDVHFSRVKSPEIALWQSRQHANFLTKKGQVVRGELPVPKQRKAMQRHVRQLNETIERAYFSKAPVDSTVQAAREELLIMYLSFYDKTLSRAAGDPTMGEKLRMVRHQAKSKRTFTYKVPETINYLPKTPHAHYFDHQDTSIAFYKRFKALAKSKKIKPHDHMVVLFDELSTSGSAPKISALDPDLDNGWTVKWGEEVHTDVVGSRIFAGLGYDVDHPYYYGENALTLVFHPQAEVAAASDLLAAIDSIYDVDLKPFISQSGIIDSAMIEWSQDLARYVGFPYVQFVSCGIEARPDRVKRLGSFIPEYPYHLQEPLLRGSILAHHFIGNWDTRTANTLLTQVHEGNHKYHLSAVFSDLGTSLGIHTNAIPTDFKAGLVNELPWDAVIKKGQKVKFTNQVNAILPCYENATYSDLHLVARRLAELDSTTLRKIIKKAGWPDAVAELYFHKLASRRASIMTAFQIPDPHPITHNRRLTVIENGAIVVKDGVLVKSYDHPKYPEGINHKKGRMRNYGN